MIVFRACTSLSWRMACRSCSCQRATACRQKARSSSVTACLSSSRHSSICVSKKRCQSNDTACPWIKREPSRPMTKRPHRFGVFQCLGASQLQRRDGQFLTGIVCRQGPIGATKSNYWGALQVYHGPKRKLFQSHCGKHVD